MCAEKVYAPGILYNDYVALIAIVTTIGVVLFVIIVIILIVAYFKFVGKEG